MSATALCRSAGTVIWSPRHVTDRANAYQGKTPEKNKRNRALIITPIRNFRFIYAFNIGTASDIPPPHMSRFCADYIDVDCFRIKFFHKKDKRRTEIK
jgi:hypothetical protein